MADPLSIRLPDPEQNTLTRIARALGLPLGKLIKKSALVLTGNAPSHNHSCYRVWVHKTTILGLGACPPPDAEGNPRDDLRAVDLVGPNWFWTELTAQLTEEKTPRARLVAQDERRTGAGHPHGTQGSR